MGVFILAGKTTRLKGNFWVAHVKLIFLKKNHPGGLFPTEI